MSKVHGKVNCQGTVAALTPNNWAGHICQDNSDSAKKYNDISNTPLVTHCNTDLVSIINLIYSFDFITLSGTE